MTTSLHNNLTVKNSLPWLPSAGVRRVNHLFLQSEVRCQPWLDERAVSAVWSCCLAVNFLLTSGNDFLAN
jgi:hypothetical protein